MGDMRRAHVQFRHGSICSFAIPFLTRTAEAPPGGLLLVGEPVTVPSNFVGH